MTNPADGGEPTFVSIDPHPVGLLPMTVREGTVLRSALLEHVPDYVVLRAGPLIPAGYLPEEFNGRWYDKSDLLAVIDTRIVTMELPSAVFHATGRFETRDDGAIAEVFELRP